MYIYANSLICAYYIHMCVCVTKTKILFLKLNKNAKHEWFGCCLSCVYVVFNCVAKYLWPDVKWLAPSIYIYMISFEIETQTVVKNCAQVAGHI